MSKFDVKKKFADFFLFHRKKYFFSFFRSVLSKSSGTYIKTVVDNFRFNFHDVSLRVTGCDFLIRKGHICRPRTLKNLSLQTKKNKYKIYFQNCLKFVIRKTCQYSLHKTEIFFPPRPWSNSPCV